MPKKTHREKPIAEGRTARAGPSIQLASGGSDTDPPDVNKPGGLGEAKPGTANLDGSDTDSGGKTKPGLGEG